MRAVQNASALVEVPLKGLGGVPTALALVVKAVAIDMVGAALETRGIGCCVGVLGPVEKQI